MNAASAGLSDLPALARQRTQVGAAPDWIAPCLYAQEFEPKVRGPLTPLLIEQQVHAELGQTYVRSATRLDSLEAVQRQSQWRLQLEPQTQSITLHSVKIRRGSQEVEHASLDRIQFLQREAELEKFMIHGWITLLLVLEDVRPGDVLDWSYTLTNRARLLPAQVRCVFALPAGVAVGKYHFSVRHALRPDLRWKSSAPDLAPAVVAEGSDQRWVWLGEGQSWAAPEPSTPPWHVGHPWIQVSECPDWGTVARAVLSAWKDDPEGEGLKKALQEIAGASPEPLARIDRAIEFVQDSFRYLSLDFAHGGQIPESAETVIRRRYGDCKDLAFLLARLLRALEVPARPVLVNTASRQFVGALLPSPDLFNHVVVEYEVEGLKRWVDATRKRQGRGALSRCVPDFGLGLPVDAIATGLVPVPKGSLPTGSYELKESFILDTSGHPSCLGVLVTARGFYAEGLRMEFEKEGIDGVARKRLQVCANRFSNASRLGQLQFRDDRDANECVLAEAFEIKDFLKPDRTPNTCLFFIQGQAAAGFSRPTEAQRQNPFALPFPCNQTHIVELEFAAMPPASLPPVQTGSQYFAFSRRTQELRHYLRVTFSASTLADSVPPEAVQQHRRLFESMWQQCGLQVRLRRDVARMRKPDALGALPAPARRPTGPGPPPPPGVPHQPPSPAPARPAPSEGSSWPHRGDHARGWGYAPKRSLSSTGVLAGLAFVAAVGLAAAGTILSLHRSYLAAGLCSLAVLPVLAASFGLALFALKQSGRRPGRYLGDSMLPGATLTLDVVLALLLIPFFAAGFRGMIRGAQARRAAQARGGADIIRQINRSGGRAELITPEDLGGGRAELLNYTAWRFQFYAPRPPMAPGRCREEQIARADPRLPAAGSDALHRERPETEPGPR